MYKEFINPLATFVFTGNDGVCIEDDGLDVDLHDNHLLPFGCKRYDECAECDIYDLLGKED